MTTRSTVEDLRSSIAIYLSRRVTHFCLLIQSIQIVLAILKAGYSFDHFTVVNLRGAKRKSLHS